jgi:hypothetical protein
MKKKIALLTVLFFWLLCPLFLNSVFADQPPDPGGGPGGGDPVGGGSPVGSGLVIMFSMAATYGIRKVFKSKNL